jgi:hypothetical protein
VDEPDVGRSGSAPRRPGQRDRRPGDAEVQRHCAAVGVNCPVGVTLFGGAPGGSGVQGTLVKGTISAPDPANGCDWTNLAMVVAAMETGNTYINVHTNDRVPPIDTRPGDFPGGEIRGQVH